jgi:hypothetical protein
MRRPRGAGAQALVRVNRPSGAARLCREFLDGSLHARRQGPQPAPISYFSVPLVPQADRKARTPSASAAVKLELQIEDKRGRRQTVLVAENREF